MKSQYDILNPFLNFMTITPKILILGSLPSVKSSRCFLWTSARTGSGKVISSH